MICVNHRQSHVGLVLYRIISKCRTEVNQMARIIVVCVLDLWFGGRLKDKAIEKIERTFITYFTCFLLWVCIMDDDITRSSW